MAFERVTEQFAVLVAAHRTGDRETERMAREALSSDHGLKVIFQRKSERNPRRETANDE